jgi:DNA-binding transcriptional LysR family regulator
LLNLNLISNVPQTRWLRRSLRTGRLQAWTPKRESGETVVANIRPVMVLDDPEALARAATCHMGIALLPLPHALPWMERGELVRVLPSWWADGLPLTIYYGSRRLLPAKVRVFVDPVVQEFEARGHAARFFGN